TTVAVLGLLSETTELRDRLERSTRMFRARMTEAGFDIRPGEHPIVPVMLYDEALAHRMAEAMLDEGIYVIGFSYPVVPKGAARIRVQISAAHTDEQIDRAVDAFVRVGRRLGVIGYGRSACIEESHRYGPRYANGPAEAGPSHTCCLWNPAG
ncbi:MAG TPA: aminotransferase class I/II-fold pyridoxal phosphate-dependent enzyme, partial [Coriobacteriia bacterium]|nr:aminotransferase class I/II-fold pyridoxal phosphate-dependent enzyme [Coriobacteriia bacterium]